MTAGKALEIILDKGLLATALVVFGFWFNRQLEGYKADQAQSLEKLKSELQLQQRKMDKRFEAIQLISTTCSGLNTFLSNCTREGHVVTDGDVTRYLELIDKVVDAHNIYHAILSDTFSDELRRYLWIHSGFAKNKLSEGHDRLEFFYVLYQRYGHLCQLELGVIQKLPGGTLQPLDWSFDRVKAEGTGQYYLENYNEWLRHRRKAGTDHH